jgi:hypothetical protein
MKFLRLAAHSTAATALILGCGRVDTPPATQPEILESPSPAVGEALRCQSTDARFRLSGHPDISLSDMERLGYRPLLPNRPASTIPWPGGHENWLAFKSAYRPGDRIRPYELSFKLGERPFQSGYALMRGDCLLLIFATRVE